jgi:hypothetical protein
MPSLENHPARLAALAAGELNFDAGFPCRAHGHTAMRNTRWLHCCACDRDPVRRKLQRKAAQVKRHAKALADIAARDAAREAQQAAQREWWKSHHSAPKPPDEAPVARKRKRKVGPHHVVKGVGRV